MEISRITGAKINIRQRLSVIIIIVLFAHCILEWHRINIYTPLKSQGDQIIVSPCLCLKGILSNRLNIICLFKHHLFQFYTACKSFSCNIFNCIRHMQCLYIFISLKITADRFDIIRPYAGRYISVKHFVCIINRDTQQFSFLACLIG